MTDASHNSPAFEDALQNLGHALLATDPRRSLVCVLETFRAEHREEVLAESASLADRTASPGAFVLWLDASDGSVPTHDGIQWPDGSATIHHRHFGITTTHHSPDAACQAAHGKQGRIVWPDPAPTDRALTRAEALRDAASYLGARASTLELISGSDDDNEGYAARRLRTEAAQLRRMADEASAAEDDGEGDELVCVDMCGSCNACGMEPFGTPAEGWREAVRFLRRNARESGDRTGALHGARLIEAELRRVADETRRTQPDGLRCVCGDPTASDTVHRADAPCYQIEPTQRMLNEAERRMLAFALDEAQEKIWSQDGFTNEHQNAVDSLRTLLTEAAPVRSMSVDDDPRLARAREVHRETCLLARGEVKPTAFTCGMCEALDEPAGL
jgi:hypothetical protein